MELAFIHKLYMEQCADLEKFEESSFFDLVTQLGLTIVEIGFIEAGRERVYKQGLDIL